jgi:osmotically-inducible protein OsmY
MNMKTLKASLLASAIALGMGVATVGAHDAHDATADRTVGQVVEDATITAAVKTKLLADTRTSGFDINVDTHAGVVTMTGGADNAGAKAAAGDLAATVEGVVSVRNDLIVAAEGTPMRTEANTATASGEIRAAVADATDGVDEEGNNPSLADMDGDGVDEVGPGPDAKVNDQVGDVDGDDDVDDGDLIDDRDNDIADVRPSDMDGDGVDEVDDANDLLGDQVDDDRLGDGTGGPSDAIDDAWITGKVKAQLLADTEVDGLDIDVDTDANVVTLEGTVETAAQREAAIRIANDTDGVDKVVADGLKIAGQ